MARIVKQIDSYDIWHDDDGSYRVMAASGYQPDRLVACVDSLKIAIEQVRRDMVRCD